MGWVHKIKSAIGVDNAFGTVSVCLGRNSERKTKDRYHSEEAFEGVSLMKQRGGASSNTGKYMNKIKHFKTLPLNEEDLTCTKANIRSTNHHLPTLPKSTPPPT